MIGYVLWALSFAGMLVLEGLGLTLRGHQWPTVSDLFRSATSSTVGRWLFFALWLWTGWHFFIRGWHFFLQGSNADTPAKGGGGKNLSATITQVIVPLGILALMLGSVLFMSYRRARSMARAPHEIARGFPQRVRERPTRFMRFVVTTVVAGHVILVVVIGVYAVMVGRSANGIFGSAAEYGAFLAFVVAVPAFVVLTLVDVLLAALRDRATSPPGYDGEIANSST